MEILRLSAKQFESYQLFGVVDVETRDLGYKHFEMYCAVRDSNTGEIGAKVVIVGRLSQGEYDVRIIGEEEVPTQVHCPLSILDQLSTTSNEEVLAWRNLCREVAQSELVSTR